MIYGSELHSFITTDGLNYTKEEGVRLETTDFAEFQATSLNDPSVIQLFDGRFRIYVASFIDDGSGNKSWNIISAVSDDPIPDIKANGSDGLIDINTSDNLSVTVELDSGGYTGEDADWWVVESTPDGWYYYSLSTSWTYAGSSYTNLSPTYQGALFDLSSYSVFNSSGLSEGTYTFYFAIDTNMDGTLDLDQLYYDSVAVTVKDNTDNSNWVFTEDNINLGISGVSPEAILLDDGSVRLYVTDMGIKVYKASDGLTFTQESASPPEGFDPTLIQLSDGTFRMYYVDSSQDTQAIWTATSSGGLSWTKESNTGISNTTASQAWGVPDSIELSDGRVRLYWVDMLSVDMPSGSNYEVIKSAISSDGVTFTEESGYRTTDGYVDPYIPLAQNENWVGLFTTTPASERLPQEIHIGISTDGLTWSIESTPIITVSGGNALDPTAVPLGDGSYRVYYAATPGSDPFTGFFLKSGVLKPN